MFSIKKILQLILTIFILSIIVFYMSRLAPGDPLASYYGEGVERLSTEERAASMEKLGLNKPILNQYINWVSKAMSFDFGISYKYKQDVVEVIKSVALNTILLGGLSYFFTFFLALLLAIFCAYKEGKLIDKLICKIGILTSCIPAFWIALLFILIFSINLTILPSSGAYPIGKHNDILGRIRHLILPVSVLVLNHLWYYAYMLRNKLVEETRQDYVLLCTVRGMNKMEILLKHCLRNIMPAFITLMAISIPHILGGTYIVEKVFSYPGLGSLAFESVRYHDYNMLMVLSLITGILVVIASFFAEILNSHIDPRIKIGGGDRLEDSKR